MIRLSKKRNQKASEESDAFWFLFRSDTEADRKRTVNSVHVTFVKNTHFFAQPLFIKRAHLFEQHYRILGKSAAIRINADMCRQAGLETLTCYCRSNNRRAEFVAHIVLHNKHRPCAALLRADNRAEVGVINFSPSDGQCNHSPWFCFSNIFGSQQAK